MKRILFSLLIFTAGTSFAQDDIIQTGTPALFEATNGKKIPVYLQGLDAGNLTFQPVKSPDNMTVPANKITRLKFAINKEEVEFCQEQNLITPEAISAIFKKTDLERYQKIELILEGMLNTVSGMYDQGDYAQFISAMEPFMRERGQYMALENNMDDLFVMLMECYQIQGNLSEAKKCTAILLESSDEEKVQKALMITALIALAENDIPTTDAIRGKLNSEASALYLQALTERAQGKYKQAMQTVITVIVDHVNDQEWMPKSELLAAYLYLDMTGTNSVISTNSVINTARQVKNIYAGSNVAGDARKLWAGLGGEAIEIAEQAERAERIEADKVWKEKQKAEAKAKAEADAAAEAAAKVAASSTNLNTTTINESE